MSTTYTTEFSKPLKSNSIRKGLALLGLCALFAADVAMHTVAAETFPLPQVATVALPNQLTKPTGVTWHKPSGQFVVSTETGQLATIDGKSFQVSGVVQSGLPALTDITADGNTVIATSSTGQLLNVTINGMKQPAAKPLSTATIDAPVTGVAIHPQLKQPLLSTDSAAGPAIWLVSESGKVVPALQLNDTAIKHSASFLVQGASPVVSTAATPLITRFSEEGVKNLELSASGMSVITGMTTRNGTIIVSGLDDKSQPILAAYDVQNDEAINPDPKAGPAKLSKMLAPLGSVSLPEGIVQASGIAYDAKSDTVLINTDQAEFYALDKGLKAIQQSSDIPGFIQGDVEDVHVINPGQAFVVSEPGSYVPFTHDGKQWVAGEMVENPAIDFEVSAIAYRSDTKQLAYIPNTGDNKTLVFTNTDGTGKQVVDINTDQIGIDNLDDYTVAGITFHEGQFYVLSEQYSTVFTMTTEGVVTAAYGLQDASEPTGLTVVDDTLWVVFDHEDSEAAKPVVRYPLS